jgi:uncharacterized damage-inducible protein DinB
LQSSFAVAFDCGHCRAGIVAGMAISIIRDAFAHHVWATIRLIDACRPLSEEQLQADVSGTFGSILDTMRHLVAADASYLAVTSGENIPPIDEDRADLGDLREAMEAHGPVWAALVSQDLDPDRVVVRNRDDGSESHAPLGIRLAQVLHHGTDHRSQICTALTLLGIEPPEIDVWDFGFEGGTVFEVLPE